MREKELRLALVCYGGISLAVYMHGITKEVWHLLRASRALHDGEDADSGVEAAYHALLGRVALDRGVRLRVLADIVAGASAGGINGIFLSHAITSGKSLQPLTAMWLDKADVSELLDPDARPLGRFTKFWAEPIAWYASGKRGGAIEQTVAEEAREEVRAKLSQFVRARWFEPPFGGKVFSGMLLDAFAAIEKSDAGPPLLPPDQPFDLFVTVTDFRGHPERLRLNSPREIVENEHRLTIGIRRAPYAATPLADAPSLVFAARATASFPGAFPPFTVAELDGVVAARKVEWPDRDSFLASILPHAPDKVERMVLIDGSVLANAPFRPAIDALRDRPARREVDRRFVYIDPKPGIRAVSLKGKAASEAPGFFATILGAMSEIPREQPIRDNLDAIERRSARIRRMTRIVDALEPEVEASIQTLFGRTFFLDRPTPKRVAAWRAKAQERAALEAGHAYPAYGHIKLSGVVDELAQLAGRIDPKLHGSAFDAFRQSIWSEVRRRGADSITGAGHRGASGAAVDFFRAFDMRFRIRRLRFVIRTITAMVDSGEVAEAELDGLRRTVFAALSPLLDREGGRFYDGVPTGDAAAFLDAIATRRDLAELDIATDAMLAEALSACPKEVRRAPLFAYLGFPYFDISTLPMLQGEGLDEFDPIKVDRIAPDDAKSIRSGGAAATLKGIEFNSFGAFFSRAYRENDYLWGRLHGAERLIDIVFSTLPNAEADAKDVATIKRQAFDAILDEEQARLKAVPALFAEIRRELSSGPLANPGAGE